jgi:hypothetical protein
MADQQAQNALRLLLAHELWRLLAVLLVSDPPQPFRGHDGARPRKHRADEAVEPEEIHWIFETVLGQ